MRPYPVDERRRAGRAIVGVAVLSVVLFPIGPPSLAAAPGGASAEPVEGMWTQSNPGYPTKVEVVASGPNTFVGTFRESSVPCLPVGLDAWHLQGSGDHYTGTVFWYESDCSERGQGETEWTIDATGVLTFCSVDPKDPNRTDCVSFTHERVVVLEGPEFVERGERFELDLEIRGLESCEGSEVELLKQVGGVYGIVRSVETDQCTFTINRRIRRDVTFKARLAGDASTESDPLVVTVR